MEPQAFTCALLGSSRELLLLLMLCMYSRHMAKGESAAMVAMHASALSAATVVDSSTLFGTTDAFPKSQSSGPSAVPKGAPVSIAAASKMMDTAGHASGDKWGVVGVIATSLKSTTADDAAARTSMASVANVSAVMGMNQSAGEAVPPNASQNFTSGGATTRSTTRPPQTSRIRALITKALSSMSGRLMRRLLQADISAECSLGVLHFMRAIQTLEPWAFRLVDATAKYPTGLLQASTANLGAYDECIETVARDEYGIEKARGQYCNVHLAIGEDSPIIGEIMPAVLLSHKRTINFTEYMTDERLPGLRLGICFIAACSEQDLSNIGRSLIGPTTRITVKNCVTSVNGGITDSQAWILAFLAILVTAIVAATAFELFTSKWDVKRKNAVPYKCFIAFSVVTNTRIILKVNEDKCSDSYAYRFVHGIRFLSIFWICLGHSYAIITENITRLLNALHYFERWETMIVTAGYQGVDSFFFFSGFLLYFVLRKQKHDRLVVAAVAMIRRFIRCTVPLFFMIMSMYLLPLIASGPNTKEFYKKFYSEVRNHWWDLLIQIRNWRGDSEVSTMLHLWYLSADYQLFVVAVIVIQTCKTRNRLAGSIFVLLSLASCAIAAWQIYGTNMTPFMVLVQGSYSTVVDTMDHYYMLPFYHGVCFFSGCITFLIVERYGKANISKMMQASLWCICLFCGLYCLFMKIEWYSKSERASETKRLFHAFTDRIIWSVCIACIAFICATGRGGIVNRFLSWNGFVPLSHLSFGVYLIHYPVFLLTHHVARERIFYSHFTLVSQCFAVVVWSYILSYFLFITCDAPTGHLEKLVFMRERRTRAVCTNGATNGATQNGISGNNANHLAVGIIATGTIKKFLSGAPTSKVAAAAGSEASRAKKCNRF
nr:nose resistant to fluoxetine protein 6-like [Dermacentor andersoni]